MFGFRLKLTLLVIILLPLLTGLGVWQFFRYEEKQIIENTYESRKSQPAVSMDQLNQYQDPLFLPMKVSGRFISEQYFLRDNQVFQGRAGYEVIMPFVTDEGQWLLVNLGWLPMISREELPEVSVSSNALTIVGSVYRSFGKPFLLEQDQWVEDWPKVIQSIDFTRMSQVLGQGIPEIVLVLNERQPETFQVRPLVVNMPSQKHMAYSVQWFTMALVLLVLYGYQLRRSAKSNRNAV